MASSTASGAEGWRKSSHSNSGQCAEVALRGTVRVRDSKDPSGPVLKFSPADWKVFTARIKEHS